MGLANNKWHHNDSDSDVEDLMVPGDQNGGDGGPGGLPTTSGDVGSALVVIEVSCVPSATTELVGDVPTPITSIFVGLDLGEFTFSSDSKKTDDEIVKSGQRWCLSASV